MMSNLPSILRKKNNIENSRTLSSYYYSIICDSGRFKLWLFSWWYIILTNWVILYWQPKLVSCNSIVDVKIWQRKINWVTCKPIRIWASVWYLSQRQAIAMGISVVLVTTPDYSKSFRNENELTSSEVKMMYL